MGPVPKHETEAKMARHERVKTNHTALQHSLLQRASLFESESTKRFFDTIMKGVNPEFEADAKQFKECFLNSNPYIGIADSYTRFWPDRTRRVTTTGAFYKNPTLGQQRTVDAWEGAVCGGVYDDIKGKRMPCNKGPLDFLTRFIPVAENEIEDEDEDDRETEDGAEKRKSK
jgi:hypothetical protein